MPAPGPLPRTARYRPTIVWGTGTGVDTAAYDDVSGYYLNQPGLVVEGIGRDQARAYAPPAAPAFDLTLNNWSGRFSPGGPIGNFVGRGCETSLDVEYGVDYLCDDPDVPVDSERVLCNGVLIARLFDGVTNTVEQTLTRPNRTVGVRALGRLSLLLDKRPHSYALYENIRTDQAISYLLDAVGWPAGTRVLDSGDTLLSYWWMDGTQSGMDVLNAILAAEGAGGCAYEQGGVFHFEGRQSRQTNNRSTETQWIFSDGFTDDPSCDSSLTLVDDPNTLCNGVVGVILKDVNPSEFSSNPDEVVASVTATINQRTETTVQKIWELGRALVLTPNQVFDLDAAVSDPYKSAVTPLLGTDYTIAAGSLVSVVLLQTTGVHVRTRWTAGPGGATIHGATSNGPQVRAVSLPVISQIVVSSTVDTSAFEPRYASRTQQMACWPEMARQQALDLVNSMASRYMQERRQAVIRVANLDSTHLLAMLDLRISDRVQWLQRHGAINDPYWIEQISHEIAPGGSLHLVTLGLERVFDTIGGRFDEGTFDESVFGD
jgi:hypothetical protein